MRRCSTEITTEIMLVDEMDAISNHGKTTQKSMCPCAGGFSRQDPDTLGTDKWIGETLKSGCIQSCERAVERVLDVILDIGVRSIRNPDSLSGCSQLASDPLPDPALEIRVALEPQFRGESNDRGVTGVGFARQIGDGSKCQKRWIIENGPGNATLSGCETNADGRNAFLNRQIPAPKNE